MSEKFNHDSDPVVVMSSPLWQEAQRMLVQELSHVMLAQAGHIGDNVAVRFQADHPIEVAHALRRIQNYRVQ